MNSQDFKRIKYLEFQHFRKKYNLLFNKLYNKHFQTRLLRFHQLIFTIPT